MAKPFNVTAVVILPPPTKPELGRCHRGHYGNVNEPCYACGPYIRAEENERWMRHYAPSTRRQQLAHSIGVDGPGSRCRGCVRGD